jgi:hypothetical protein
MAMTENRYLIALVLLASLLLNLGNAAAESREISWDDLVPAEAEFDDAFTRLDEDTLYELTLVAGVRDRLEAGTEIDEKTIANYRERVEDLENKGVDVDGLMAMREKITEERIALPATARVRWRQGHRVFPRALRRRMYPHPSATTEPDRPRQNRGGLHHRRGSLYTGLGQWSDENRAESVQSEPG